VVVKWSHGVGTPSSMHQQLLPNFLKFWYWQPIYGLKKLNNSLTRGY
jgi:hypothetical protein